MEASTEIRLLGTPVSPFVNRVQLALNLKSLNYEFLTENLADKSELLLKLNPVYKKVPVLIHGNKPICDSLVILEYIDEVFPNGPSILPSDHYDRATARFWAVYIDDKLFALTLKWLFEAKDEESKAAVLEKLREGVGLLEDAFVKSSHGKGFFGGDSPGYLDFALGCHLGGLRIVEMDAKVKLLDETKTPTLAGWAERIKCHEVAKKTLPDPQVLFNLIGKSQEAQAAAAAAKTSD